MYNYVDKQMEMEMYKYVDKQMDRCIGIDHYLTTTLPCIVPNNIEFILLKFVLKKWSNLPSGHVINQHEMGLPDPDWTFCLQFVWGWGRGILAETHQKQSLKQSCFSRTWSWIDRYIDGFQMSGTTSSSQWHFTVLSERLMVKAQNSF